jgi:hypothetical protein
MPRPTAQDNPYIENLMLRQRARELVAQSRRIIDEIEDILLFDIQCAKNWRDARRGVSWGRNVSGQIVVVGAARSPRSTYIVGTVRH